MDGRARKILEEGQRKEREREEGADILLKVKIFGPKEGSGREPLDYMSIFSLPLNSTILMVHSLK